MTRRRTRPSTKRTTPKGTWWALGALVVAVAVAAFFILDGNGNSDGPFTPVSSFQHVHGLAVDPEDSSTLYVATHHGLIRGTNGGDWVRVGSIRDYMGFSVHPTNGSVFWASGHPRPFSGEPNPLGVIHSTDGGITWDRIGLSGVDLHAMAVSRADANRSWGYGGTLYTSTDGGHTWSELPQPPEHLTAFGPHPIDPATVYAGTPTRLLRSDDGGDTWAGVDDAKTHDVEVHPVDPLIVYAAGDSGLRKSTDGGGSWEGLGLAVPVGHIAIDPSEPETVWATTLQAALHKSEDGGATWIEVKEAE